MKEFYVYGLTDPRTNAIFYIGKVKKYFNIKRKS